MDFSPLLARTDLLSHQPLDYPGPQGNRSFILTLSPALKVPKMKAANIQGWLQEPQIQGISSLG